MSNGEWDAPVNGSETMPKKGGKGKGKKEAKGEEGVELTDAEKTAKANLRIEALERELVQRTDIMNRSIAAHNEMRQRQAELMQDFDKEKTDTFAITADMTRQYKAMQEELLKRLNVLESTIQEQKDQLELARQANEDLRRGKDQELANKDAQIADLKQKMEDMAIEFGDMLKDTLDKMSEKIEATSSEWDKDTGVDVQKKLDDFNIGSMTT